MNSIDRMASGHKELLNVGNGEDNKAADLTSPTMVSGHCERNSEIGPELWA